MLAKVTIAWKDWNSVHMQKEREREKMSFISSKSKASCWSLFFQHKDTNVQQKQIYCAFHPLIVFILRQTYFQRDSSDVYLWMEVYFMYVTFCVYV